VAIANPLSETFAVLRPSALPGLLAAVAHNRRRQQPDVRLFEIGAGFSRSAGERRLLAFAWTGSAVTDHWSRPTADVDFFDVKDLVERLCRAFRIEAQIDPCSDERLTAGRRAAVLGGGRLIGVLGLASAHLTGPHGLAECDVYVAEIDLDAAEALAARGDTHVEPLPRYPTVTRDLSLVVSDTLPAATLRRTAVAAAPSILVSVREFDRYQGTGIPEGCVSLSIRMTFRAADRTLTDAEVHVATERVLEALQTSHAAIQR
jgi:phenylalanyl-tRNA synthetase beta chain